MPGPFRIDVPLQQVAFRAWLGELGLREPELRVEMARAVERLPWQVGQRFVGLGDASGGLLRGTAGVHWIQLP